jgi:two-component system, cell cycle response regulator
MARILIVEDNPTNLELMTYLLSMFGHTTLAAHDGEAGVAAAYREMPDLVICDVQLPVLDGYAVARQLKATPDLHMIPLIAVTALAMVGDRERAMAAGFDGYIAKPITPELFVGQVEAFLPAEQRSFERPPAATADSPAPTPPRTTLLVVDHSRVNVELARSMLEPSGYAVIAASGATEGLALARQARPDLILADADLSWQDGDGLLRAVKSDPNLAAIPVLLIASAGWRTKDRATALELGAARLLVRPIEPYALLAEVAACLSAGDERESATNATM